MTVACPECGYEFIYESVPESGMGYVDCPDCGEPVTQNNEKAMKILIDPALKGKELTKFLVDNCDKLIAQKKSIIKRTDPVTSIPTLYNLKGDKALKTTIADIPNDATSVRVKVVANTALWMDSQYDVLIPDCWKTSIKQRKGMIPHLHDHIHEIGAEVGDVADIYSQDVSLTDLGLNKSGKTQCLIFETDIRKSYNEAVFNKYSAGRIKQHSIGLQYVKMSLAINDEDSQKEFDFWTKYIKQVINRDVAEEAGFFWVIEEIKLLENSAVLFGSNELTPTLDVKVDTTLDPGLEQPSPFDLSKAIKETKLF